jgi:hypothetical protein
LALEAAKEKLKTLPGVERASAKLAAAFQGVFGTTAVQAGTGCDRDTRQRGNEMILSV